MTATLYLIRYGAVPEVARCRAECDDPLPRGTHVVVETHRGQLLGEVLERLQRPSAETTDFRVLRTATPDDRIQAAELVHRCQADYASWCQRISEWGLSLELVDLEWTLDGGRLILYVLTERGPETTQLALQAAAAGFGVIEVQPVSAEGLLALPSSGSGCGSGGCGCHS